jgi:hypothetical protein
MENFYNSQTYSVTVVYLKKRKLSPHFNWGGSSPFKQTPHIRIGTKRKNINNCDSI